MSLLLTILFVSASFLVGYLMGYKASENEQKQKFKEFFERRNRRYENNLCKIREEIFEMEEKLRKLYQNKG